MTKSTIISIPKHFLRKYRYFKEIVIFPIYFGFWRRNFIGDGFLDIFSKTQEKNEKVLPRKFKTGVHASIENELFSWKKITPCLLGRVPSGAPGPYKLSSTTSDQKKMSWQLDQLQKMRKLRSFEWGCLQKTSLGDESKYVPKYEFSRLADGVILVRILQ